LIAMVPGTSPISPQMVSSSREEANFARLSSRMSSLRLESMMDETLVPKETLERNGVEESDPAHRNTRRLNMAEIFEIHNLEQGL